MPISLNDTVARICARSTRSLADAIATGQDLIAVQEAESWTPAYPTWSQFLTSIPGYSASQLARFMQMARAVATEPRLLACNGTAALQALMPLLNRNPEALETILAGRAQLDGQPVQLGQVSLRNLERVIAALAPKPAPEPIKAGRIVKRLEADLLALVARGDRQIALAFLDEMRDRLMADEPMGAQLAPSMAADEPMDALTAPSTTTDDQPLYKDSMESMDGLDDLRDSIQSISIEEGAHASAYPIKTPAGIVWQPLEQTTILEAMAELGFGYDDDWRRGWLADYLEAGRDAYALQMNLAYARYQVQAGQLKAGDVARKLGGRLKPDSRWRIPEDFYCWRQEGYQAESPRSAVPAPVVDEPPAPIDPEAAKIIDGLDCLTVGRRSILVNAVRAKLARVESGRLVVRRTEEGKLPQAVELLVKHREVLAEKGVVLP